VTTTTISENQFRHARAQRRGLSGRVSVVKRDYRELQGQYDKLVSIEMIEAVGYRYFDTYVGQMGRLLKPTGLALIQAITIEDARFHQYRRGADFIRRFIFPGGCLPSISSMLESTTRTTDMTLVHLDDIGQHDATTLQHWSAACIANEERILRRGYSHECLRMWQFYLSYCEGGVRERSIGDAQLLLARPFWRARI
jgi:cyclopropane-fatty-acyl-phospholipid synthase